MSSSDNDTTPHENVHLENKDGPPAVVLTEWMHKGCFFFFLCCGVSFRVVSFRVVVCRAQYWYVGDDKG